MSMSAGTDCLNDQSNFFGSDIYYHSLAEVGTGLILLHGQNPDRICCVFFKFFMRLYNCIISAQPVNCSSKQRRPSSTINNDVQHECVSYQPSV